MITLIWLLCLIGAAYVGVFQAITILGYIGHWKVYKKAGYEGWEAIVPFYNSYVLFKIVFGSGWLFLLTLIPVGGVIASCITYFQLGRRFGKSTAFNVGLLLFPWVFTFILGIEKSHIETRSFRDETGMLHEEKFEIPEARYQAPGSNGKKAMVLSSAIVGGVNLLLSIFIIAALIATAKAAAFSFMDNFNSAIEDSIEDSIGGAYDDDGFWDENELPDFGGFGYQIPDQDEGSNGFGDFNFDEDDLDDFLEQYGIEIN